MNLHRLHLLCILSLLILATSDDGSEYGNHTHESQASIQDPTSNTSATPARQRPAAKARWGAPNDARRAAWVVVVSNDNLTRHYYDLLLANLECLRQTNSKYEVALLYEGELDEETQTAFKALNVSKVCVVCTAATFSFNLVQQLFHYPHYFIKKGIDISALEEKTAPARDLGHMWHKSWNKLAAWALPRYASDTRTRHYHASTDTTKWWSWIQTSLPGPMATPSLTIRSSAPCPTMASS